jgi:hypothetical protein
MRNAAGEQPGGVHGDLDNSDLSLSISRGTDRIETRNARSIRLHHVLVRRRRLSRELDRLLGLADDPWTLGDAR